MKPFFIAIEGNIGAGKTTLARQLASKLRGRLLLERFEENPFLKDFYRNPKKFALQTELWFLTDRIKQVTTFLSKQTRHKFIVADYSIEKCLVFAKANLPGKDFNTFYKQYNYLVRNLPIPDLTLFLSKDLSHLKKNISKRGRAFESKIKPSYLECIHKGYEKHFGLRKNKDVFWITTTNALHIPIACEFAKVIGIYSCINICINLQTHVT